MPIQWADLVERVWTRLGYRHARIRFIRTRRTRPRELQPGVDSPAEVLEARVLLSAENVFNNSGDLWVTDGTTGGTFKLTVADSDTTRLSKAGVVGTTTAFNPTALTRFGNSEVLFTGSNSKRTNELWITDGTSSGTFELTSFPNPPVLGDAVIGRFKTGHQWAPVAGRVRGC